MRRTLLLSCAVCAWLSLTVAAQRPSGFTPLLNGTLQEWSVQGAEAGNFAFDNGVLKVQGGQGWLRSARQYSDFSLRVEFRFLTPDADSGIFFRAAGEAPFMRGWPNQSYQVQVRDPSTESRFPPVGGLFRHGMPAGAMTFDAAAVTRAFTGTGRWQVLEIDVRGSELVVRLNGTEVNRASNIGNASGYIGIQSEMGALEYRALDIRGEAR